MIAIGFSQVRRSAQVKSEEDGGERSKELKGRKKGRLSGTRLVYKKKRSRDRENGVRLDEKLAEVGDVKVKRGQEDMK